MALKKSAMFPRSFYDKLSKTPTTPPCVRPCGCTRKRACRWSSARRQDRLDHARGSGAGTWPPSRKRGRRALAAQNEVGLHTFPESARTSVYARPDPFSGDRSAAAWRRAAASLRAGHGWRPA